MCNACPPTSTFAGAIPNSLPDGESVTAGALNKNYFDRILKGAKSVRVTLERLQGEHLASGEDARSVGAAGFIAEALPAGFSAVDPANPFPDLIRPVDVLITTTERAKEKARRWLRKAGRKKGSGAPALAMFVMGLLEAAEQTGGKLTIYRNSHKATGYDGSLLRGVNHLRPVLPARFLPAGTLGSSLQNVYRRWRSESEKSRRKSK